MEGRLMERIERSACRRVGAGLLATTCVALAASAPALAHLSIIRQGAESAGALESGDLTGFKLAVGDFNGDGYDDLAIGVPYETIGSTPGAGAVVVVYGTKNGLTHEGAHYRSATTIGGTRVAQARFGDALAAGDFNGDGYDDLAIGAPGDQVSGVAAGRVYVLHGSSAGLGSTMARSLTQNLIGGVNEAGDQFGAALAVGDFNGVLYDDLAIGTPGEDTGAGAVSYVYGSIVGLTTIGAGYFKQSHLGGTNTPGDSFGRALAAGQLYGLSYDDLVVSAPNRDVPPVVQQLLAQHAAAATSPPIPQPPKRPASSGTRTFP
jgi:hypothetical protein